MPQKLLLMQKRMGYEAEFKGREFDFHHPTCYDNAYGDKMNLRLYTSMLMPTAMTMGRGCLALAR